MENHPKVPAFTLRLSKEMSDKLTKIAKAYDRPKTWTIELLILSFDDSPERLAIIEARTKLVG